MIAKPNSHVKLVVYFISVFYTATIKEIVSYDYSTRANMPRENF